MSSRATCPLVAAGSLRSPLNAVSLGRHEGTPAVNITTRAAVSVVIATGLLAPLRAAGAEGHQDTSLSGTDVLSRMVEVYRTCRSYRDTGVVRTVYFEGTGQRTQELSFKTAFVRPDSFRFEFTDTFYGKTTRYIVSQQGADVRKWWDLEPGVQTLASLDMGLAGATGVSGGSAHTIPSLLVPETVSGRSLKDMTGVKRLDDARCGGAVCVRLEGVYAGDKRTLWIELGSFLLRRIDSAHVFPTFRTETTTSYEPTVNEAIPLDVLAFDPPLTQ